MISIRSLFLAILGLLPLAIAPKIHSFTHEQTKTFTLLPADLTSKEATTDLISCREMVEEIKRSFVFSTKNVKIRDKNEVWQTAPGIQIPTVYLLVIDKPEVTHGRIATTQPFIKALNAFYKAHDLPHDADLAEQASAMLKRARENALENEIKHIETI